MLKANINSTYHRVSALGALFCLMLVVGISVGHYIGKSKDGAQIVAVSDTLIPIAGFFNLTVATPTTPVKATPGIVPTISTPATPTRRTPGGNLNTPVITFTAASSTIAYNTQTSLSWTTANAVFCEASWGSAGASGTYKTPNLATTTTYMLACTNAGNRVESRVTVNVLPEVSSLSYKIEGPASGYSNSASAPFTLTVSTNIKTAMSWLLSDGGIGGVFTPSSPVTDNNTMKQTFTYTPKQVGTVTITASQSGRRVTGTSATYVVAATPVPVITFSAASTTISYSSRTTLTWDAKNALACQASWGSVGVSGTYTTPSLTASTVYTLACTNAGNKVESQVTVDVLPEPTYLNYKIEGPAKGYVNSTSTPFTLTVSTNMKSPITWLLSDGSMGGTFTPPSFTTDPNTIAQSFVYIPKQVGTVNLSASQSGRRTSGTGATYVVTTSPYPAPKIVSSSYPVLPGEVVQITGSDFSPNGVTMLLARVENTAVTVPGADVVPTQVTTEIKSLQADKDTVSFVLPSSLSNGVFAYRLRNNSTGMTSNIAYLNKPDVWFYTGDLGKQVTPGGWVEVYGRSMSVTNLMLPTLALVSSDGTVKRSIQAKSINSNYSVRFAIPADLPTGSYSIYMHNGDGGVEGWSKFAWNGATNIDTVDVVKSNAWPTRVFDFSKTFGFSNDAKMSSLIDDADSNGGGVIYLPAGTYYFKNPIILPNKTVLRGDGKGKTFVYWAGDVVDTRVNPHSVCGGAEVGRTALISGKFMSWLPDGPQCASFSMEDITAGHTTSDDYIVIKRTYTRDVGAWFRRITCATPNIASHSRDAKGSCFWIRAVTNTEISDSMINAITGIQFNGDGGADNTHVRLTGNTFRWRNSPYMITYGNRSFVLANNTLLMAGNEATNGIADYADVGEGFGTFGSNIRDIYYAFNSSIREDGSRTPFDSTVDLTFDGTQGAYSGRVVSVSGATMKLAKNTTGRDQYNKPMVSPGAIVQIISGKGKGQIRTLQSSAVTTNTVTVSSPWDVEPDATSWIQISDYQGRYLFVANNFANHPRVQFYFPTSDIIFTSNTLGMTGRKAEVNLWAAPRYSGFSTGMNFLMTQNKITKDGAQYINIINALEDLDNDYDGYSAISQVFSGNSTDGSLFTLLAGRMIDGMVIDGNKGLTSITFDKNAKSKAVVIKGNKTSSGTATPVTTDGNPVILP